MSKPQSEPRSVEKNFDTKEVVFYVKPNSTDDASLMELSKKIVKQMRKSHNEWLARQKQPPPS
ncbi:hypothetical protein Pla144_19100 [Bythopirellula polymerisocia]|uniref:Uncharacterized protein n=1 Tax=Bythopirellula polymerisocia TaxID=2528003 RepID=A0A5C6CW46_9BACT|nr:hypothetical protein Pla144_19100 [Bythopirellula polymerisocia]